MKFSIRSLLPALLVFSVELSAAERPNKQMGQILEKLNSLGGIPIETLSPEEARKQPTPADAVKHLMRTAGIKQSTSSVISSEILIDGANSKLKARVYRPVGKGPMPLVVYYHGGGFVIADLDVYDATPRSLAQQTGAIFLSVDYNRGPEAKFPVAHDDAFAAYQWAVKHAAMLGADPKVIAVAGESAGANLALDTAIKARDSGIQLPVHEMLVYPVAGSDMNTESYQENADAKPLNKAMMEWFFKYYLNNESEKNDPRINLIAANFKDLAPATVITAEIDPLRSEGKLLAERMQEQGIFVSYKNYIGVTHEFFGMASVLTEAIEAQSFASQELKKSFLYRDDQVQ